MNKNSWIKSVCLLAVWIISVPCSQAAESTAAKPKVAIITTGGTIAEKIDPKTGAAVPALDGSDLIKAVPQLADIATIDVVNFCNIDSSQMTPEIWQRLSSKVDELLAGEEYAGAVITHGTDTMAIGAFFLDLTLKTDKPVVFVGAMKNASDVSPDGPGNLLNAVRQVCSSNAQNWGVTVTMNQYINSARDVVKTETTNPQTFKSGEKGYLGYIIEGRVIRFHDRFERQKLPLPEKLPKVVLLTTYAGDDGDLVRHAADSGAEGLVIEGVGAGNVNSLVFDAIKYAMSKGVTVLVTTRVQNGGVYGLYGDQGGGKTLETAGAILTGDLKGPKARIFLMLALPAAKGDNSKLKELIRKQGY